MKTQVKERPILFKGEMVRAILDGRKTQTRRVVKGPYSDWEKFTFTGNFDCDAGRVFQFDTRNVFHQMFCPFGSVGDRLRISENVKVKAFCEDWYSVMFDADNLYLERQCDVGLMQKIKDYKTGYLRGVHLSPAFARPTRLEITGVRVERLQEITRGDCMDEGCPFPNIAKETDPKQWFADLWQSINGPDSWAANPWVWVVEFKKVSE